MSVSPSLRLAVILLALSLTAAALPGDQPAWLPPEAEAVIVEQLGARLSEIGWGESVPRRDERVRESVAAVRGRIDQWGPATLIARAPAFADLKMPATASEHLNAMARYTMCSLVLALQLQSKSADMNNRVTAVLGLTATTLVVLRLREPYVAGGGTDGAMEKFLSDNPALEAEVDRMQDSTALLTHARSQCAPVLEALVK